MQAALCACYVPMPRHAVHGMTLPCIMQWSATLKERVMPCNAIVRMPCRAMPCHAMPCHAMSPHAHAASRHTREAMPCHAMPCHASAMPCSLLEGVQPEALEIDGVHQNDCCLHGKKDRDQGLCAWEGTYKHSHMAGPCLLVPALSAFHTRAPLQHTRLSATTASPLACRATPSSMMSVILPQVALSTQLLTAAALSSGCASASKAAFTVAANCACMEASWWVGE